MNWITQNWIWILFGIGALLLLRRTGCFGGTHHAQQGSGRGGDNQHDHSSQSAKAEAPVDPVSGKVVANGRAVTSVYQGRVFYFETAANRQRFEASPEQYAIASAGQSLPNDPATERAKSRRRGGCC